MSNLLGSQSHIEYVREFLIFKKFYQVRFNFCREENTNNKMEIIFLAERMNTTSDYFHKKGQNKTKITAGF